MLFIWIEYIFQNLVCAPILAVQSISDIDNLFDAIYIMHLYGCLVLKLLLHAKNVVSRLRCTWME